MTPEEAERRRREAMQRAQEMLAQGRAQTAARRVPPPPSAPDFNVDEWRQDYTQAHNFAPGEGNRETERDAIANKLWGVDFARSQGRNPTDADYQQHYAQHQAAGSDEYKNYLRRADGVLSLERGRQQAANRAPIEAWQRAEAADRQRPAAPPPSSRDPYAIARQATDSARDMIGGVFGNSTPAPSPLAAHQNAEYADRTRRAVPPPVTHNRQQYDQLRTQMDNLYDNILGGLRQSAGERERAYTPPPAPPSLMAPVTRPPTGAGAIEQAYIPPPANPALMAPAARPPVAPVQLVGGKPTRPGRGRVPLPQGVDPVSAEAAQAVWQDEATAERVAADEQARLPREQAQLRNDVAAGTADLSRLWTDPLAALSEAGRSVAEGGVGVLTQAGRGKAAYQAAPLEIMHEIERWARGEPPTDPASLMQAITGGAPVAPTRPEYGTSGVLDAVNPALQDPVSRWAQTLAMGAAEQATRRAMGDETVGDTLTPDITARDLPAYKAADTVDENLQQLLPANPDYDNSFFFRTIPQGVGSTVPIMAASAINPAAGFGLGALAGAGSGYQRPAISDEQTGNKTPAWKKYASALTGAALGATEAIPIGEGLEALQRGVTGGVGGVLSGALRETAEEAIQEFGQSVGESATDKYITGINPDGDIFAGATEAATAGGVTGFLMNLLGAGIGGAANFRRAEVESTTAAPATTTTTEGTAAEPDSGGKLPRPVVSRLIPDNADTFTQDLQRTLPSVRVPSTAQEATDALQDNNPAPVALLLQPDGDLTTATGEVIETITFDDAVRSPKVAIIPTDTQTAEGIAQDTYRTLNQLLDQQRKSYAAPTAIPNNIRAMERARAVAEATPDSDESTSASLQAIPFRRNGWYRREVAKDPKAKVPPVGEWTAEQQAAYGEHLTSKLDAKGVQAESVYGEGFDPYDTASPMPNIRNAVRHILDRLTEGAYDDGVRQTRLNDIVRYDQTIYDASGGTWALRVLPPATGTNSIGTTLRWMLNNSSPRKAAMLRMWANTHNLQIPRGAATAQPDAPTIAHIEAAVGGNEDASMELASVASGPQLAVIDTKSGQVVESRPMVMPTPRARTTTGRARIQPRATLPAAPVAVSTSTGNRPPLSINGQSFTVDAALGRYNTLRSQIADGLVRDQAGEGDSDFNPNPQAREAATNATRTASRDLQTVSAALRDYFRANPTVAADPAFADVVRDVQAAPAPTVAPAPVAEQGERSYVQEAAQSNSTALRPLSDLKINPAVWGGSFSVEGDNKYYLNADAVIPVNAVASTAPAPVIKALNQFDSTRTAEPGRAERLFRDHVQHSPSDAMIAGQLVDPEGTRFVGENPVALVVRRDGLVIPVDANRLRFIQAATSFDAIKTGDSKNAEPLVLYRQSVPVAVVSVLSSREAVPLDVSALPQVAAFIGASTPTPAPVVAPAIAPAPVSTLQATPSLDEGGALPAALVNAITLTEIPDLDSNGAFTRSPDETRQYIRFLKGKEEEWRELAETQRNPDVKARSIARADGYRQRWQSNLALLDAWMRRYPDAADALASDTLSETTEAEVVYSRPAAPEATQPPSGGVAPQQGESRATDDAPVLNDSVEGVWVKLPVPSLDGPNATAFNQDYSTEYQFEYKVVSLDSLIPSNLDNGQPNTDYPQQLQPRDRTRAASTVQIQKMANEMAPGALLGETNSIASGSPIIGQDMAVESGNGRTLSLRMARSNVPDSWNRYQEALRGRVEELGMDTSALAQLKDPVLVRVRVTPVDRVAFAKEANQSGTLTSSPVEQAGQDAERVSDEMLSNMTVGDGQTIEAALRAPINRGLVRQFVGNLPTNERAAVMTGDSELNKAGLTRLKTALFAKTYPGEAGARLTETFSESLDSNTRNIENALFASLPQMAKAEGLIRAGLRDPELSIADDVAKTVDVYARLKEQGVKVSDYVAQVTMFERELNPFQEQLLLFLDKTSRSPKAVREFLQQYADAIEQQQPLQQVSMFEEVRPTKGQLVERLAPIAGKLADAENRQAGFDSGSEESAAPAAVQESPQLARPAEPTQQPQPQQVAPAPTPVPVQEPVAESAPVAAPAPSPKVATAPVNGAVATDAGGTVTYSVIHNPAQGGIEVSMGGKPAANIIATLKQNGFRWSGKQKLWWGKYDPARWNVAAGLAGQAVSAPASTVAPTPVAQSPEPVQEAVTETVTPATPAMSPDQVAQHKAVVRLRQLGKDAQARAEEALGRDRLANTHRRADMAAHAERQAQQQLEIALTMQNIADALEAGEIETLTDIRSKAQVEALDLLARQSAHDHRRANNRNYNENVRPSTETLAYAEMPYPYVHGYNLRKILEFLKGKRGAVTVRGYVATYANLDSTRLTTPERIEEVRALVKKAEEFKSATGYPAYEVKQIKDRFTDYDRITALGIRDSAGLRRALTEYLALRAEGSRADPIKAMERKLVGTTIPGYFPTPVALAQRMVDMAQIEPGMRVLEPSAGKGNIADALKTARADVDTIEYSDTLKQILDAKGHKVVARDFTEFTADTPYDRIVMNPPFENGQDIDHVRHAYDQLKPGGRLVAIMSEGAFGRNDRKASDFRTWLDTLSGTSEKMQGAFAQGERATGVATRLVVIDKPADAQPAPAVAPAPVAEVAAAPAPQPVQEPVTEPEFADSDPVLQQQVEGWMRTYGGRTWGTKSRSFTIPNSTAIPTLQHNWETGEVSFQLDNTLDTAAQQFVKNHLDAKGWQRAPKDKVKNRWVWPTKITQEAYGALTGSYPEPYSHGDAYNSYKGTPRPLRDIALDPPVLQERDGKPTLTLTVPGLFYDRVTLTLFPKIFTDPRVKAFTPDKAFQNIKGHMSGVNGSRRVAVMSGDFADAVSPETHRAVRALGFTSGVDHAAPGAFAYSMDYSPEAWSRITEALGVAPAPTPSVALTPSVQAVTGLLERLGIADRMAEPFTVTAKDKTWNETRDLTITRTPARLVITYANGGTPVIEFRYTVAADGSLAYESGARLANNQPVTEKEAAQLVTQLQPPLKQTQPRDTSKYWWKVGSDTEAVVESAPAQEPVAAPAPAPNPTPRVAPQPASVAEGERAISDFGEKIGGARKDTWKARQMVAGDLSTLTDREAVEYATKDNIWHKPDYADMVEGGMPATVAYVLKKVRDSLPVRPDYYSQSTPNADAKNRQLRERYLEGVERVRNAVATVKSEEDVLDLFRRVFPDRDPLTRRLTVHDNEVGVAITNKAFKALQLSRYDLSKAKQAVVKTNFPGKREAWEVQFGIDEATYKPENERWRVFRKSNRVTQGYYPTREAAIEGAKASIKARAPEQSPDAQPLSEIVREGPDLRNGRDITEQEMLEAFGFRGGEFGNWTNQVDRQLSLNHAYDAMHDLARALNLPPRALSLNGELGIAFGARGSGGALAHYESTKVVINLTKTSGAGSLAHEWAHAVDDYFGRLSGDRAARQPYVSHGLRATSQLRPEVREAWNEAMRAMRQRPRDAESVLKAADHKLARYEKTYTEVITALRAQVATGKKGQPATPAQMEQLDTLLTTLRHGTEGREGVRGVSYTLTDINALVQEVTGKRLIKERYDQLNNITHWMHQEFRRIRDVNNGEIKDVVPTDYLKKAEQRGEYWERPQELFARSFESYILDRLREANERSDYLVSPVKAEQYKELYAGAYPYPEGTERTTINGKLAALAASFQTKATDTYDSVLFNVEEGTFDWNAMAGGYSSWTRLAARAVARYAPEERVVYVSPEAMYLITEAADDSTGNRGIAPMNGVALNGNGMIYWIADALEQWTDAGRYPAYSPQGRMVGSPAVREVEVIKGRMERLVDVMAEAARDSEGNYTVPFAIVIDVPGIRESVAAHEVFHLGQFGVDARYGDLTADATQQLLGVERVGNRGVYRLANGPIKRAILSMTDNPTYYAQFGILRADFSLDDIADTAMKIALREVTAWSADGTYAKHGLTDADATAILSTYFNAIVDLGGRGALEQFVLLNRRTAEIRQETIRDRGQRPRSLVERITDRGRGSQASYYASAAQSGSPGGRGGSVPEGRRSGLTGASGTSATDTDAGPVAPVISRPSQTQRLRVRDRRSTTSRAGDPRLVATVTVDGNDLSVTVTRLSDGSVTVGATHTLAKKGSKPVFVGGLHLDAEGVPIDSRTPTELPRGVKGDRVMNALYDAAEWMATEEADTDSMDTVLSPPAPPPITPPVTPVATNSKGKGKPKTGDTKSALKRITDVWGRTVFAYGVGGTAALFLASPLKDSLLKVEWDDDDEDKLPQVSGYLADVWGDALKDLPRALREDTLWTLIRGAGQPASWLQQMTGLIALSNTDMLAWGLPSDRTAWTDGQRTAVDSLAALMQNPDKLSETDRRALIEASRLSYSGAEAVYAAYLDLKNAPSRGKAETETILQSHENWVATLVGELLVDPTIALHLPLKVPGGQEGLMRWRQWRAGVRTAGLTGEAATLGRWDTVAEVLTRFGDKLRLPETKAVRAAQEAAVLVTGQIADATSAPMVLDRLFEFLGATTVARPGQEGADLLRRMDARKVVDALETALRRDGLLGDLATVKTRAEVAVYDNALRMARAAYKPVGKGWELLQGVSGFQKKWLSRFVLLGNPGYLNTNALGDYGTAILDGGIKRGASLEGFVPFAGSKAIAKFWDDVVGMVPRQVNPDAFGDAANTGALGGKLGKIAGEQLRGAQVFTAQFQHWFPTTWRVVAQETIGSTALPAGLSAAQGDDLVNVIRAAWKEGDLVTMAGDWARANGHNVAAIEAYARDTLAPAMRQARSGAIAAAEAARNQTLLNYADRTYIDVALELYSPYQFWQTHSMPEWIMRVADHPKILAGYGQIKDALTNGMNRHNPEGDYMRDGLRFGADAIRTLVGKIIPGSDFLTTGMSDTESVYIDMLGKFVNLEQAFALTPGVGFTPRTSEEDKPWYVSLLEGADRIPLGKSPLFDVTMAALKAAGAPISDDLADPNIPLHWARPLKAVTALLRDSINGATGSEIIPKGGVNLNANWRQMLGQNPLTEVEAKAVRKVLADWVRSGRITQSEMVDAVRREDATYGDALQAAARQSGDRSLFSWVTGFTAQADPFTEINRTTRDAGALETLYGFDSPEVAAFYDAHPDVRATRLARKDTDDAITFTTNGADAAASAWIKSEWKAGRMGTNAALAALADHTTRDWKRATDATRTTPLPGESVTSPSARQVADEYAWWNQLSSYQKKQLRLRLGEEINATDIATRRTAESVMAVLQKLDKGDDLTAADAALLAAQSDTVRNSDPQEAERVKKEAEINALVTRRFPLWEDKQDEYIKLSAEERKEYLKRNPDLKAAWQLREAHMESTGLFPATEYDRREELRKYPVDEQAQDTADAWGLDSEGMTRFEVYDYADRMKEKAAQRAGLTMAQVETLTAAYVEAKENDEQIPDADYEKLSKYWEERTRLGYKGYESNSNGDNNSEGGSSGGAPSSKQTEYAQSVGVDTEGLSASEVADAIDKRKEDAARFLGYDYANITALEAKWREYKDNGGPEPSRDEKSRLFNYWNVLYPED